MPQTRAQQQNATEGQRGYVTLLFSDLCGYTQLNESSDPEDADELRREVEALAVSTIRKHGGAVSQVYGDGVLAVFGLPAPREDDVRRAVEAALELHERIHTSQWQAALPEGFEVCLHSGIHSGLVFARQGDELHGRYELTGDAVVTASRLCSVAARDEILVSGAALLGNEAFFSTELAPELALKGKKLPVAVHRVTGRSGVRTRFEARARAGLTPFVGRTAEIDRLTNALERSSHGAGGLVLVTGTPGIGKTRLLEEFRARAAASGVRSLRGACESYGDLAPLEPFVQMLRQLFGVAASMRVDEAIAVVSARVQACGEPLLSHLPTLLQLLSLQPWPSRSEASGLKAVQALAELIESLKVLGPLALVLDDWQWADETSRKVLERLCRNFEDSPVCIVVAVRSGEGVDPVLERADVIALQPFSEDDSGHVVHALRPHALGLGVAHAIHRRSGGNALFIEELCRSLPEDSLGAEQELELHVPSTLHGVIQARVALLPEPHARVLRVASAMGGEFSPELLARAAEDDALDTTLGELLQGDLIVLGEFGNNLRFKHGITREVIYESVRIGERRRIHRAIAQAIEQTMEHGQSADQSEALAYHYRGSGDHDRAAAFAELAGQKALATSSLDRARFQYEMALSELDKLPASPALKRRWLSANAQWAVVCVYSPAWSHLRIMERAVVHATELGDSAFQAAAEHWLGWLYHVLGEQDDAIVHYQRAKQVADQGNHAKLLAQILASIGQSHVAAGQYPEALEHLALGLDRKRAGVAGRSGQRVAQGFAYALGCKAVMHAELGEFAQAERDLGEAFDAVRGSGHAIEGSVLGLRCMVQIWRGEFQGCLDTAAISRKTAERVYAPYVFAMSHAFEGYASFTLSPGPDALRQMRNAIDWLEARDIGLFISFNYGCLADALERSGDAVAARDFALRALLRVTRKDLFGEGMAYRALARIHAAEGPAGQLQQDDCLTKALRSAAARGSRREVAVTRLLSAQLQAKLGQLEQARATAHEVEQEFARMGMAWHAEQALRVISSASDG